MYYNAYIIMTKNIIRKIQKHFQKASNATRKLIYKFKKNLFKCHL